MDINISRFKENGKAVGVLTTDLSTAYDTVDAAILLNKLERIGVRGKEQELMRTYLMNRKGYTEIQGFTSILKQLPDCSVVQGGKLSSTLYTIYTLDVTEVIEIMTNPTLYKEIVDSDIQKS